MNQVNAALAAGTWPMAPVPYLYIWGVNQHGQIGDGTVTNRSSPVQVGALTNWLLVASGLYNSIATKEDGTLWSWGQNNYGKLGLGDAISRSSPVQVGALTTWKNLAAGWSNSMATTG